jgi:hypothetical protein
MANIAVPVRIVPAFYVVAIAKKIPLTDVKGTS